MADLFKNIDILDELRLTASDDRAQDSAASHGSWLLLRQDMRFTERLIFQLGANDAVMPGAQTASRKQQRGDEPIDLSKSPLQYPQSVFRSSALFQLSRELGKPCDSAILRKVLQVHDVLCFHH